MQVNTNLGFSNKELAQVHTYLKESNTDEHSIVHALVIEFILLSGCRTSEAISLRINDVLEDRMIWDDTKTGKKVLPLTDRLSEIIEEARKYNTTSFVFRKRGKCTLDSLANYWGKIRKELSLPDVRLHDLRHTFASFAIQAGYSMEHVRDLLGHKNILTTQKYTHLSQDDLMFAMKDVAKNMGFNRE